MKVLDALQDRIQRHIPLAGHLAFRLRDWSPGRLEVTAPLDVNINDKGTFFAGSQAALLALSGWALTTLEAEADGASMDVVAVESSLCHRAPAPFDARLIARAEDQDLTPFRQRLRARGRAKLPLTVVLEGPEGQVATTYEGLFMARRLEEHHD